jgi:hypothetical protein
MKNGPLRKVNIRFEVKIQNFTVLHRQILHARLVLDKRMTE